MTNRITLILGQKGSGKSTLAKEMISKTKRLIILDPMGEYRAGIIAENINQATKYLERFPRSFRLITRFQADEDLDEILDLVWEVGSMTLLAEEIDSICTTSLIHPTLEKIIKYGRHREINLIAISRRASEVSRLLSSQADEIISFRQEEPRDLEYLAKRNLDPEKLKSLDLYQSLSTVQGVTQ